MKRAKSTFLLFLISGYSCCSAALFASQGQEELAGNLDRRMRAVQEEYRAVRKEIIQKVNQWFGIDYALLEKQFLEHDRLYQQQLAIAEKIEDDSVKRKEIEKLRSAFTNAEYIQYAQARLVLENELERNHTLRARCLEEYEKILDEMIANEPIFSYFFGSPEYRNRHGLLLKRIVWRLSPGESASTKELSAYSVFSDREKTPFLVILSPSAFSSISFLRSILLHELNHVLLEKEGRFAALDMPADTPKDASSAPLPNEPYSLSFKLRHGKNTEYQYHLLHEFYSFKAQLLYDDALANWLYFYRLSGSDRERIEKLCSWAEGKLNEENRKFVKLYPEPPIISYLRRFSQAAVYKNP